MDVAEIGDLETGEFCLILKIKEMIGHLKPATCGLSSQNRKNYQLLYCSLCASLRKQNHLGYALFIHRELTLILSAVHNIEAGKIEGKTLIHKTLCPAKVFVGTQPIIRSQNIDKAAQMAVLLVWLKIVDWTTDQGLWYHHLLKYSFHKKAYKILHSFSTDFQEIFKEYLHITQENSQDFERVNDLSARFSEMMFQEIAGKIALEEEKLKLFQEIFGFCGRLIHIADHLIDIEKDLMQQQYNPILQIAEKEHIPLNKAYLFLQQKYNATKIQCFEKLQGLKEDDFVSLLKNSIQQLDNKITKYRPYFIKDQDMADIQAFKSLLLKQDCDCGGCDGCDCGGCHCDGCHGCDCGGCDGCGSCYCDGCCEGCSNGCDGCHPKKGKEKPNVEE
jgi:hypothetical protein